MKITELEKGKYQVEWNEKDIPLGWNDEMMTAAIHEAIRPLFDAATVPEGGAPAFFRLPQNDTLDSIIKEATQWKIQAAKFLKGSIHKNKCALLWIIKNISKAEIQSSGLEVCRCCGDVIISADRMPDVCDMCGCSYSKEPDEIKGFSAFMRTEIANTKMNFGLNETEESNRV